MAAEQHSEDGSTTCEECLDWRMEQTRYISAHILEVVRNIVTDLGLDLDTDERVREIVGRRLREVGAEPGEPA